MKYHLIALAVWAWSVLVAYVCYRIDPWSLFVLQGVVTFLGMALPVSQIFTFAIRNDMQEGKADG